MCDIICRTCANAIDPLGVDNSVLITEQLQIEDVKVSLSDALRIFVLIQVKPNDSLPKVICNNCKLRATDAYSFWKMVINSEKKLLKASETNIHVKEEPPDEGISKFNETIEIVLEDPEVNIPDFSPLELIAEENLSIKEYFGDNKPVPEQFEKPKRGRPKKTTQAQLQKRKPGGPEETAKKEHICQLCGMVFTSKFKLNEHIKITHLNVKPFICQECGKCFPFKYLLRNHEEIHSNNVYRCEQCGKTFNTIMGIRKHTYYHKNFGRYKCTTCKAAFAKKCSLQKHELSHTQERSFKCVYCGKRFNTKGSLKIHITIHTGEKPFLCNVCEKSFRLKTLLKVHTKTNHLKGTSKKS